jgi:hypothetical protein
MSARGGYAEEPVSAEELEAAHDRIRMLVSTRFSSFRSSFRQVDFARSGKVTRREALRILTSLHLTNVRSATLMELLKMADRDNDGLVAYDTFATLMMSEEPLRIAKARETVAYSHGGPWMPQGGEPLVLEATMGRQFMPPRLPQTLLSSYRAQEPPDSWDLQSTLSARTSAEVFQRGKPFDRTMWLERNRLRRQEEILAKNQAAVRYDPPGLTRDAAPSLLTAEARTLH